MKSLPQPEDLFCEAVQASLQIEESAEIVNIQLKIVASLLVDDHWERGRDYARALLPKILIRIRELEDEKERAYLLRLFITQQCEMGLVDDAIVTLSLLDFDADHQAVARRDIAIALARVGELTKAMETADEIEDLDDYETVLENIGEGQIRQRRFHDAIQTAAKIEAAEIRSQLLRFIASEQWKAGLHDDALQTLRSAQTLSKSVAEPDLRDRIYARLVGSFVEIHRVFDALSLAKEISDPVGQIQAFCSIVVLLQESGNAVGGRSAANEAVIAARKISEPFHRAKALESVGEALHRIGDVDDAKDIFREALASIKSIRNSYSQTCLMTGFGSKLSQIGMSDIAKRVFRLAAALAQDIEGTVFQLLCLCRLVEAQTACSLVSEADNTIKLIEEIRDELSPQELADGCVDRDWVVSVGAVAATRMQQQDDRSVEDGRKQFQQALEVARKIPSSFNRAVALQNLATRLKVDNNQ